MPDEMLHLPMVNSLLERHKRSPGALLPILHEIQEGIGYIPDAAIPRLPTPQPESGRGSRGDQFLP